MKRLLSAVLTLALLLIFVTPQARAGGQTKGCIALTFDDGPSGDLTERLLDGLRARGVFRLRLPGRAVSADTLPHRAGGPRNRAAQLLP